MTAVVLIAFNRPDLTRQTLASLAAVRPETLFLIADGPRADRPGDGREQHVHRGAMERL